MSLLRVLGRPMLASIFIAGGLDTLRNPQRVAGLAEPVVKPVTDRIRALPDRTEDSVRLNGAVQVAAGLLLATGRMSRPAALAIAATLVPTTLAAHRFWEEEDSGDKAQHRIHFLKNLGLFGGLLIVADDTGGRPSMLWRSRHAAHDLRREAHIARRAFKAGAGPAAAAGRARAKLSH
ncbi:DoxX family protein [Streptomyces cellulosae]|nr:DoxX family protein [Streptomyces cellulosae]